MELLLQLHLVAAPSFACWCCWAIIISVALLLGVVPTAEGWATIVVPPSFPSEVVVAAPPALSLAGGVAERPSTTTAALTATTTRMITPGSLQTTSSSALLQDGVTQWLSAAAATTTTTTTIAAAAVEAAAPPPPSPADVQLLRAAFAEFYGANPNRDLAQAQDLLSQTIERWERQPADERAGLYRVRGDCRMLLADADAALRDYDTAVRLLQEDLAGPSNADPQELPASLLGRARAAKVLALQQLPKDDSSNNQRQQQQQLAARAANDYERALKLSSREDWDTDAELLEDGAARNPYAAWEYGDALRLSGQYREAAEAHALAAAAFGEIGDAARSAISLLDSGIDWAFSGDPRDAAQAEAVLAEAIPKTKGVRSLDLDLLRRVMRKEGEGRMALAATLWASGDAGKRPEAERTLGDACVRLDQLQAQLDAAAAAAPKNAGRQQQQQQQPASTAAAGDDGAQPRLLYSIDDDERGVGPLFDCSKFRNPKFVKETLGWPESLQAKVAKLETLR